MGMTQLDNLIRIGLVERRVHCSWAASFKHAALWLRHHEARLYRRVSLACQTDPKNFRKLCDRTRSQMLTLREYTRCSNIANTSTPWSHFAAGTGVDNSPNDVQKTATSRLNAVKFMFRHQPSSGGCIKLALLLTRLRRQPQRSLTLRYWYQETYPQKTLMVSLQRPHSLV